MNTKLSNWHPLVDSAAAAPPFGELKHLGNNLSTSITLLESVIDPDSAWGSGREAVAKVVEAVAWESEDILAAVDILFQESFCYE